VLGLGASLRSASVGPCGPVLFVVAIHRRARTPGGTGGRGDGPLSIHASQTGPAAPHLTDAAAGGP
jgi:hypothetical protein